MSEEVPQPVMYGENKFSNLQPVPEVDEPGDDELPDSSNSNTESGKIFTRAEIIII